MNKPKMICFDMDGTIADLYNVPNWLEMLRNENPAPYLDAEPMWDMVHMAEILKKIQQAGIEIRIITWLSMNSTEEYKVAVREAKRAWLEKWGFVFDHFHGIQYGATKADSIRRSLANNETAWLIDDNEKVRKGWHLGETINPITENIIEIFKLLLTE